MGKDYLGDIDTDIEFNIKPLTDKDREELRRFEAERKSKKRKPTEKEIERMKRHIVGSSLK